MRPRQCVLAMLLTACEWAAAQETTYCLNEEGYCNYPATLSAGEQAVWCVRGEPLLQPKLLTSGLAQLFDVQTVRVRGVGANVQWRIATEDGELVGWFANKTAEQQVQQSLEADVSAQSPVQALLEWCSTVWTGDASEVTRRLSPYYSTCVGVRAKQSVEVRVEFRREGPRLSSTGGSSMHLWAGPLLFVVGLLLFLYANYLAESVIFHYATSVSLAMAFSVLVLFLIIWHRTGRTGRTYLSVFGSISMVVVGLREWVFDEMLTWGRSHWPYVLLGLCCFGIMGFAFQFLRLKGGRPPPHECTLVALLLRIFALAFIWSGPYSVSAKISLLLGTVVACWGGPLLQPIRYLLSRLTDRGPERPASWYRPPTKNGRYLTEEQYEMQKERATKEQLTNLFQSPEYQRWLLNNHNRLSLGDDGMRQPFFEEEEDS